jgi:hypothetical protein
MGQINHYLYINYEYYQNEKPPLYSEQRLISRHANWLGVKKVRMMRELRKTQTRYRVPGLYSGEFSFTFFNVLGLVTS